MQGDDCSFNSESSADNFSELGEPGEDHERASSGDVNGCAVDLSMGRTRNYASLLADAEKLLSHDSLFRAAISSCCKKECIADLSPLKATGDFSAGVEALRQVRLPLARLSNEERYDHLKLKMEGKKSRFCSQVLCLTLQYFVFYRNGFRGEKFQVQHRCEQQAPHSVL